MTPTAPNALNTLAQTEATLIRTVQATTARVNQIGTTDLAGAMAGLRDAVEAAKGRITAAVAELYGLAGDLADSVESLADSVEADLEAGAAPVLVPLGDEPVALLPAVILPLDEVLAAEAEADQDDVVDLSPPVPCPECSDGILTKDGTCPECEATQAQVNRIVQDSRTSETVAQAANPPVTSKPARKRKGR